MTPTARTVSPSTLPRVSLLRRQLADTRPLAQPDFRRLWIANIVTVIGAQLSIVAVPQQVFEITRSSAYVGLTGVFALVPLMIGAEAPGKEILHPVAITIFGGLVTATVLDAILTPTLVLTFGRGALKRLVVEAPPDAAPPQGAAHPVTY